MPRAGVGRNMRKSAVIFGLIGFAAGVARADLSAPQTGFRVLSDSAEIRIPSDMIERSTAASVWQSGGVSALSGRSLVRAGRFLASEEWLALVSPDEQVKDPARSMVPAMVTLGFAPFPSADGLCLLAILLIPMLRMLGRVRDSGGLWQLLPVDVRSRRVSILDFLRVELFARILIGFSPAAGQVARYPIWRILRTPLLYQQRVIRVLMPRSPPVAC